MATSYCPPPAVTNPALFDRNAYPVESTEDEHLLYLVRIGDKEALSMLFERYSRLAVGIGSKILQDRCEAEDLAQDIFLSLFCKSNTFDPDKGTARTWMVQFIYRQALNRRVYLARRHFYDGVDESVLLQIAQAGAGFDELIATRLDGRRLRRDFKKLGVKQRSTLELCIFEGFSLREISEQTGDSLRNTRKHYYRGIEKLKRQRASATLPLRKSRTDA